MTMAAKTCVITGASRGIGLAIARRFARGGNRIVAAARDEGRLRQAAEQIRTAGGECDAVAADVATLEGARRLIDRARTSFQRVDVLVNNVGAAPLSAVEKTSDADFEAAIAANCAAVFYTTRAAWPIMREQGGGTIVNISSMSSVDPFPGFSVYGACKAWVNLFTKAAADEGKAVGIRVFAVAPGAVETDMLRSNFPKIPREQTLDPDDVAGLVEAVCDRRMDHSTGQTIFIRK
jgi:NAD(P)-dependent dehydrogenase (short-subunit alcohol dehydrogenase family)